MTPVELVRAELEYWARLEPNAIGIEWYRDGACDALSAVLSKLEHPSARQ